jgi:N-acetylglucosamine-6-sulfatase
MSCQENPVGRLVAPLLAASFAATACTAAASSHDPGAPGDPASGERPNFLIIVTDDQRYGTMEYMPRTQARIFDQGVTFTDAYVTTSLCGPSRASILTGMYAHTHNVRDNGEEDDLEEDTFVRALHEAGYYTGIVGKYVNAWGKTPDDEPCPEFDFWVAHGGMKNGQDYFKPLLNVDGTWEEYADYLTYVERDYALDFLAQAEQRDQPFLLIFALHAPHFPADPAPGDESLYLDLPAHRPPSYDEADVSDKPRWLQKTSPLTSEQVTRLDEFYLKQLQSLNTADEVIESVLEELDRQGTLDETVVFFLSDNGVLLGEHRLYRKKNAVYQEAVHVPFALRYPALVPEPRVESALVANIDIAPTIYDLAGIPIPRRVDGRSLVPLLRGEGGWRDSLLLEAWAKRSSYQAIHTGRYVYVDVGAGLESGRDRDETELYDLADDPYQLENRSGDPAYADLEADLRQRLKRAQAEASPLPPVWQLAAAAAAVGLVAFIVQKAIRRAIHRSGK